MVRFKSFILIIFSLALLGCKNIFAPELGVVSGSANLIKSELLNPSDVLTNFKYAYIYRDSLVYSTLIDSDFVFLYYEPEDQGGSGHYASWGRETEIKTTGGLLRAFSHIDLIWNTTLDSNFYYYKNDVLIESQKEFFEAANYADVSKSFQLNLGSDIYLLGTAQFDFIKNASDEQWRIVRWRDESVK